MRFFALLRQAKHTAADGGQFLRDAGKRPYTAGHIRVPAVAYAGDDEDQALLGGAALGGRTKRLFHLKNILHFAV